MQHFEENADGSHHASRHRACCSSTQQHRRLVWTLALNVSLLALAKVPSLLNRLPLMTGLLVQGALRNFSSALSPEVALSPDHIRNRKSPICTAIGTTQKNSDFDFK